ncbi:MAG TPA: hypothetical protein DEG17_21095 [Cyanobacteria bacterium UBA11149]|nr:hypothetical protein [Cyanobacteria bacterium UBA11367]HBE57998.1 hypothetical protein [Cyanobacteria bacterium UBA11366]HBK62472.1 hypothetical protein [Cyanobacteria bacterium UBA11166]HBR73990.1 hypothetical protein [Cyanobacteria bacterium UBA11159]HBS72108.1 hypothetical protein [Cyanobacteria bacterium UBA11153]HBW91287.1 hypothetical protein [Cyanobacteria bacterium UBA11149]HCA96239.1 hypothetical protein [Cyanobacteria bacterium UBA9226]
MNRFTYFHNSSQSGNNLLTLTFVIALAINGGVLFAATKCHAKTSELYQEEYNKSKLAASISLFPKVDLNEFIDKNNNKESTRNNSKGTTANKDQSDPNTLLRELRERVRQDLLASRSNTESYVDVTLDSIPIGFLKDPPAFLDGSELKKGAIGSLLISQNSPARAYVLYIKPLLEEEQKLKIEKLDKKYGGANLYTVKKGENVEFYMSLVGIGAPIPTQSFIVFWKRDPGGIYMFN